MTINTQKLRDLLAILEDDVGAVPILLDHIEAQSAEIARLNAIQAWQPIETAPKDGTAILLGSSDGAWIAKYDPVYPSGYRPKNPWFSLMLNRDYMGRVPNAKPTHWMSLPAAPSALSGESKC
ncbi:DUF551 domain-containing protein [Castellaniella denitrificans]|uniref:DUF551 domain-containing protein n=1 Tax=Castellaniella denitrificans TaxID=56119 RepID=A0ABT4M6V2_9BURK|nr:DUF551 domain-containing protein [Castellaniella denitrificans]MCZ4331051.1 DUF551 domain-containing protein [Castellaniella denitrificans]